MTTAENIRTINLPAQTPPRKRRRKTASGAHEDCFACRRKGASCDRKRPYCTPCIESGRDCPGYKTTLTWNVGVASRGKLRGLSCPVTIKNPDGSVAIPTPEEIRRRTSSSVSKKKAEATESSTSSNTQSNGRNDYSQHQHQHLPHHAQFLGHTSVPGPVYQPALPTIPSTPERWHFPGSREQLPDACPSDPPGRPSVLRHPSLQHIHTSFTTHYGAHGMPQSASSVGSFTDVEYPSPLEYPQTPGSGSGSATYADPFTPTSSSTSRPPYCTSQPVIGSLDSYADVWSTSADSSLSGVTSYPGDMMVDQYQTHRELDLFDPECLSGANDILFSPGHEMALMGNPIDHLDHQAHDEEITDLDERHGGRLSLPDLRFSSPFFHVTPRLQSLMEYYDRHICPYLVAFDGPENPYRKYILQLAMHNDGLQNAVAALATNNLRMRRLPPYRPPTGSIIEDAAHPSFPWTSESNYRHGTTAASEPNPEETCYKQLSIEQLNLQLTDVRVAQDDSVLATLLILCLFHVCDSGFSKFKTQLAGVQRLLSLRAPPQQQHYHHHHHQQESRSSDFTRWVEMFFVWFDVMTSAVNDREVQIRGDKPDLLDYATDLGALEQFSGCDGRLFKLIARLGRLNLLAQGRAVKVQHRRGGGDAPYMPPHVSEQQQQQQQPHDYKPAMHKTKKTTTAPLHRSLCPADYEFVDGNGWGSPISSSDEEADSPPVHDARSGSVSAVPDDRREFWDEWHDIRDRLRSWQMDSASSPSTPPLHSSSSPSSSSQPDDYDLGQRDLQHINESFRHSALLYTERLAHPLLPSAHARFQHHVRAALAHVRALALTSCVNKFLLWPLFLAGAESVAPADRALVRARCLAVQQESGFYNNRACLDLLEKVWADVGSNLPGSAAEAAELRARRKDSAAGRTGRYGQAFRWRKAMDRVDGEYIVI